MLRLFRFYATCSGAAQSDESAVRSARAAYKVPRSRHDVGRWVLPTWLEQSVLQLRVADVGACHLTIVTVYVQVAAMNGEMMATIQEVEKIHAGLRSKCVERAHLRAEIAHYEEKVCNWVRVRPRACGG
jgi:hypothetical protein